MPTRTVTFADREESFDLSKRELELDFGEDAEESLAPADSEQEMVQRDATMSEGDRTLTDTELAIRSMPTSRGLFVGYCFVYFEYIVSLLVILFAYCVSFFIYLFVNWLVYDICW